MNKIALVTLMKNHSDLTMALIDSINTNEDYDSNYLTIWIADTGSEEIEKDIIKQYISKIPLNIHYIEYDYYNFAKINNDIIKNHVDKDTELICLCNNDVQLINNAITKAVNTYNNFENIGTVGSLLLYPDFTIQHGGITLFYNKGRYDFSHILLKEKYNKEVKNTYITWGNTGAFMLTSYDDYMKIGGLNENYEYCFEDVEYNLRLLQEGKVNLTCYDALCFHKESSTRHQKMSINDVNRIRDFCGRINVWNIKDKILDKIDVSKAKEQTKQ